MEKLQNICNFYGSKCISDKLSDLKIWHEFKCKNGHFFKAKPVNIIYPKIPRREICPLCPTVRGELRRKSISTIIQVGKEAGYSLHPNSVYKNLDTKITWIHDKCGREIETGLRELYKGSPCKYCKKLLPENASDYAIANGGKLLSFAGGNDSKSVFECGKGHVWQTSWSYLKQYSGWCPKCRVYFISSFSSSTLNQKNLARKSLQGYQKRDRQKGRENDLDVEYMIEMKSNPCFYCKRQATGVDRIDNNIGHLRTNCVPACVRCNWVRGNYLSFEVMIEVGLLLQRIDP